MPTLDLQSAHLRLLLDILAQPAPEAEVWAYASRVIGGAHDGSDLDLVLRRPGRLSQPRRNLAGLRQALVESNLPMLISGEVRVEDAERFLGRAAGLGPGTATARTVEQPARQPTGGWVKA